MAAVLEAQSPPTGSGDNEALRGVKRYQLALPTALYTRVQRAAEERDVTVVQLLRAFIKLGMVVLEAENRPGYKLVLRTEEGEQQLVLV